MNCKIENSKLNQRTNLNNIKSQNLWWAYYLGRFMSQHQYQAVNRLKKINRRGFISDNVGRLPISASPIATTTWRPKRTLEQNLNVMAEAMTTLSGRVTEL